jgi:hypothetical protein
MRRRAFLRLAAAAAVEPVCGLAQRRDASDGVTLDAAARAYRVQPGNAGVPSNVVGSQYMR